MSFYGRYNGMAPSGGGGVTSLDGLTGALTLVAGTGISIVDGTNTITISSTSAGDVTLAAFGSTPNANAASLSGQALTLQPASGSFPGGVSTTTQTFAGSKTFSSLLNADGGIDRSTSGTLTIGATNSSIINIGNSGATVNIQGTTIYENTPHLIVADPLITVNSGGGAGSGQNSGIEVEENSLITGYLETSSDRNSWILKAPNTAGIVTVTPGASGFTLDQGSHNPVTIGTANGLSLATQVLSLDLSSTSTTGALSSTDWNTFNNKQATLTLTNLTDVGTDGIVITNGTGAVVGASPVTIAQHVADTTHNGYLSSTDWNTFNGKQASGNYITALTGDAAASGPGSAALTLATVNSNVGSFGSATQVGTFTVNAKGLVTAAANVSIAIPFSQVSGTVPINQGGTGQITKAAGFDALSPMTTGGDLIYGGASGTGTRLANGTAGNFLMSNGSTLAPGWSALPTKPYNIQNLGLAVTVGSSAMTIALKQADGSSDPSTNQSSVQLGMRSSTAATGAYVYRSITAALSLTVSSGSTLGLTSAKQGFLWVYLVDSDGAGAMQIAVSQTRYDDGSLQTTVAEGGAGAADSGVTLYSVGAYSSKPVRLIARILTTQTTAGTWASLPTEISLAPDFITSRISAFSASTTGTKTLAPNGTNVKVPFDTVSGGGLLDTDSGFDTSNNRYYVPSSGAWQINATVFLTSTNVLANNYQLRIFVNGSLYRVGENRTTTVSASTSYNISTMIPGLFAGDYIEIFLFGAGNNSTNTLTTDSGFNDMSFTGFKVGNV